MKRIAKLGSAAALTLFIAGCGGGGGGGGPVQGNKVFLDFTDPNATGSAALDGAFLDTASGAISAGAGTIDLGTGAYSFDGDTGNIDLQAGTGTVSGGGNVSIFGLQANVAGAVVQPVGAATQMGFVGQATGASIANAPATATFTGASKVVINDTTSLWTLDGSSSASIDFIAGSGSASLSNLNGTKADFGGGTSNVTNVATIGMNNLNVSGNAFTGNQVTVSSNQLGGLLTGNSSVNVQGGFFGPQALNVGGVLSVDDTASGVLSIQGAFTGTR